MEKIIYIYLLIISINEIFSLKFGEEIPFDIKNNEFELTFKESGAILISVTFGTPNILSLNLDFKSISTKKLVSPPGEGVLFFFYPNVVNKIKLEYLSPSNENGTIWMLPSTYEVDIKLNQTYEWKYNIKFAFINTNVYQLSYSINKAEKDAILEFKYNNNFNIKDNLLAPNPSKICIGEICKNGITTYNIIKGESYKIIITINIIKGQEGYGPTFNTHYLPSFSFHFIYEEEKKQEEKKEIKKEDEKKEEEKEKKEEEKEKKEEKEKEKEKKEEEKEKTTEKLQKKENSDKSSNKFNVFLILLGILLLGGIVLTIFLICRKKAGKKVEEKIGESMKFEFEKYDDNNNIEGNTDELIY